MINSISLPQVAHLTWLQRSMRPKTIWTRELPSDFRCDDARLLFTAHQYGYKHFTLFAVIHSKYI